MESQPTKIASLLGNRLVRHGLFWLVIILSYPIASLAMQQSFLSALIVKLFYLPTQIVAAYLLVYFQLPQLLYKKRYGYFALSIFLSAYLLGTLTHGIIDHVLVPTFSPDTERCSWQKILFGFDQADAFYVVWVYWVPVLMAIGKLLKQSLERREAMQQLEKEKIQVELDALQAQLHPRFLSNTLKTLHRLSIEQSDEAPELIAHLSDMLDYMLYQAQASRVPLAQEIEMLEIFFKLESLRQHGNMQLNTSWPVAIDGIQVAPLLLFSLIENALVQEEGPAQKPFIFECQIKYLDNHLIVHIHSTQTRPTLPNKIQSLQQQLDWLYPNQHDLTWEASTDHLKASLKVQL